MQDWIDLYCERSAFGPWGEPLNLLTNLSFILAALVAAGALMKRGETGPGGTFAEWLLVMLAAAIGVGSGLFHAWPVPQTELADVVPIWSFVAVYILTAIHRSTGGDIRRTAVIDGIVILVVGGIFLFTSGDVTTEGTEASTPLNGSLQYAPAVIALLGFAGLMLWKRHPARYYFAGAAVTFVISLCFRTVDLSTCTATGQIGTHFMWHLLNGLMIGLLLLGLILKMPPAARPGR